MTDLLIMTRTNYIDVIARVDSFEVDISRESLAHSKGLKDDLQLSPIFERNKDFFTPKMVRWARKRVEKAIDPVEKRRAEYLFDFFLDGMIGNRIKKTIDEEATYESKAMVNVDGKDIQFRQLPLIVQNEEVRAKRKAMIKASIPVKKKLTGFERKMLRTVHRMVEKNSGEEYVEYYAKHKELDLEKFAATLRGFLSRTDEIHSQMAREQLAKIGVPLEKAETHDYAIILRTKHYDKRFPKEKLEDTLRKTLLGLGIDLEKQSNVHLDLSERPKKVPRAFCSPIIVPDEIHLVTKPHGGQQDYQTLLHESGHAEHFAHTDPALAYELKHMGGHAVSECYAFLFEYLTHSKMWLRDVMEMPDDDAEAFVKELTAQKLFMLRRYCAKFLYELQLHRDNLTQLDDDYKPVEGSFYKSMPVCYQDILWKATKVKPPKENWLLDVDSGFYSADYLRAWMLEAGLRTLLEKRYGDQWYTSRSAGAFLRGLWKTGANGRTINELADHLGLRLDTQALEEELKVLDASVK